MRREETNGRGVEREVKETWDTSQWTRVNCWFGQREGNCLKDLVSPIKLHRYPRWMPTQKAHIAFKKGWGEENMSDIGLQREVTLRKNVHRREGESMHSHDPNTRVFLFWYCRNNVCQILWLKKWKSVLSVLEDGGLNVKMLSGPHSLQRLWGEPVALPAFGGHQRPWMWLRHLSLCLHLPCVCLCPPFCVFYKDTCHWL